MTNLVPAWDKRTGTQLPNLVPKFWLDRNVYPHLAGSQQAATAAQKPSTDKKGA